jgi:hypothetical protein
LFTIAAAALLIFVGSYHVQFDWAWREIAGIDLPVAVILGWFELLTGILFVLLAVWLIAGWRMGLKAAGMMIALALSACGDSSSEEADCYIGCGHPQRNLSQTGVDDAGIALPTRVEYAKEHNLPPPRDQ